MAGWGERGVCNVRESRLRIGAGATPAERSWWRQDGVLSFAVVVLGGTASVVAGCGIGDGVVPRGSEAPPPYWQVAGERVFGESGARPVWWGAGRPIWADLAAGRAVFAVDEEGPPSSDRPAQADGVGSAQQGLREGPTHFLASAEWASPVVLPRIVATTTSGEALGVRDGRSVVVDLLGDGHAGDLGTPDLGVDWSGTAAGEEGPVAMSTGAAADDRRAGLLWVGGDRLGDAIAWLETGLHSPVAYGLGTSGWFAVEEGSAGHAVDPTRESPATCADQVVGDGDVWTAFVPAWVDAVRYPFIWHGWVSPDELLVDSSGRLVPMAGGTVQAVYPVHADVALLRMSGPQGIDYRWLVDGSVADNLGELTCATTGEAPLEVGLVGSTTDTVVAVCGAEDGDGRLLEGFAVPGAAPLLDPGESARLDEAPAAGNGEETTTPGPVWLTVYCETSADGTECGGSQRSRLQDVASGAQHDLPVGCSPLVPVTVLNGDRVLLGCEVGNSLVLGLWSLRDEDWIGDRAPIVCRTDDVLLGLGLRDPCGQVEGDRLLETVDRMFNRCPALVTRNGAVVKGRCQRGTVVGCSYRDAEERLGLEAPSSETSTPRTGDWLVTSEGRWIELTGGRVRGVGSSCETLVLGDENMDSRESSSSDRVWWILPAPI
jgi:hypothetical protein